VRFKGKSKRPMLKRAIYKSGLEDRLAQQLEDAGVPFTYEEDRLKYVIPERQASYRPDFNINGKILIEAKGYFRGGASDRQKLALIKEQHPNLDIRLVFQKASNPIYKGSKTTYAQWADSHGFQWADKGVIPPAWIIEATK
jgi:hypothetical protein